MKASIFKYLDYRKAIIDLIHSQPNAGRGERKGLAEALGCQMAFITHVLSGEKDFNHEQILKVAQYFHLNEAEKEYFLELLSFNRAGTKELQEFYKRNLMQKREQHKLLKNNHQESQKLTLEDQAQYYSHWLYGALHMASTVPTLQSIDNLVEHFKISKAELLPRLEFLASKGLLNFQNGRISPGNNHLYVDKNSPMEYHHHAIWRIKALHDLKTKRPDDFKYTMCFSASEKDWPLLREKLADAIKECLKIIHPSKEEKLGLLCIDFQEV